MFRRLLVLNKILIPSTHKCSDIIFMGDQKS